MSNDLETKTVSLHVNGQEQTVDPKTHSSLLAYLRSELRLSGTKQGCGTGNCGACSVLVDEQAVQSCQLSVAAAAGTDVKTIDGILGTPLGNQISNTLIQYDAAQCGYCLPGIVIATYAELRHADSPDAVKALQRNLCRCGTHTRILAAVTALIKKHEASQ